MNASLHLKKEMFKIGVFFKCFNALTQMCLLSNHSKDRESESIFSTDHNFLAITTYLISFKDKPSGFIISLLLFFKLTFKRPYTRVKKDQLDA